MKEIEYQSKKENLSSITIQLHKQNTEIFGLYYSILGIIAWRGISIIEVISTTNELTIILKDNHVSTALESLIELKKS